MEIVAYAMSIVAVCLFLRLLQETIACKNAEESLNVTRRERDVARHDISLMNCEMATVHGERNKAILDLERANQTIADMMSDLSIVRMERQGAVEELEKVTKERNELKDELGKCHAEYDQFIVKHHGMVSKLESILTDAKSDIP